MRCNSRRRIWNLAACAALALPAATASEEGGAASAQTTPGGSKLPVTLPLKRDQDTQTEGPRWNPVWALLALAGLAGGMWAWRSGLMRHQGRRTVAHNEQAILRISSQSLTPQASVHTIRWKGEEFLLGCTPQQVTLLSRRSAMPAGEEP